MGGKMSTILMAAAVAAITLTASVVYADGDGRYVGDRFDEFYNGHGHYDNYGQRKHDGGVQLGPRPFYLMEGMDEGRLKERLLRCEKGPFYRTDFSIAHRGAPLQFPEHTKESYQAGARMGAGIVECDVTFTNDAALVCRHSECDLHTTTNIDPRFGKQALYLDDFDPTSNPPTPRLTLDELKQLKQQGVKIFAPPIPALLAVNAANEIVPSQYALDIKTAGLDIITWSFERSDLRQGASRAGFYYSFDPAGQAVKKDSDMYKALDVLARKVGILGIFSDWPATVTYYANCMGLK